MKRSATTPPRPARDSSPAIAGAASGAPALAGIGVRLQVKEGRCLITQISAGGAAAKDGRLKAGDEIMAVAVTSDEWTPLAGKQSAAIIALIRGPAGTSLRLKIHPHDKPDAEVELALTRAPIALPKRAPEAVDPGLMSGLVFAGANTPAVDGKDDGILTALEVAALDLSKVDTVVLSACETGLGQSASGEGLLGLQRAFQVAGAKTAVASLWKVPDAATGRLMQRFYENMWNRKLGRLAALQEAQIFMIRDRAGRKSEPTRGLAIEGSEPADDNGPLPPHQWATFVLSGDWR